MAQNKTPWIVNDSNRKIAVGEYLAAATRYHHNNVTAKEIAEWTDAANHLNIVSLRNETAMLNYICDRAESEDPKELNYV